MMMPFDVVIPQHFLYGYLIRKHLSESSSIVLAWTFLWYTFAWFIWHPVDVLPNRNIIMWAPFLLFICGLSTAVMEIYHFKWKSSMHFDWEYKKNLFFDGPLLGLTLVMLTCAVYGFFGKYSGSAANFISPTAELVWSIIVTVIFVIVLGWLVWRAFRRGNKPSPADKVRRNNFWRTIIMMLWFNPALYMNDWAVFEWMFDIAYVPIALGIFLLTTLLAWGLMRLVRVVPTETGEKKSKTSDVFRSAKREMKFVWSTFVVVVFVWGVGWLAEIFSPVNDSVTVTWWMVGATVVVWLVTWLIARFTSLFAINKGKATRV